MVSGLISSGGGDTNTVPQSRLRMVVAHVLGGTLGGAGAFAAVWLGLAFIRAVVPNAGRFGVVAVIALWAVLADLGRVPYPRFRGQVPQRWYRIYGPSRSYGLYGAVLGGGFATRVNHAFTWVVVAFAGLLLAFPEAVAVGAAYGAARATTVAPGAVFPRAASRILYSGRATRRSWAAVAVVAGLALASVAGAMMVTAVQG